jgi:hypothetical protein
MERPSAWYYSLPTKPCSRSDRLNARRADRSCTVPCAPGERLPFGRQTAERLGTDLASVREWVGFRVELEHLQYLSPRAILLVAGKVGLSVEHPDTTGFPNLLRIDQKPRVPSWLGMAQNLPPGSSDRSFLVLRRFASQDAPPNRRAFLPPTGEDHGHLSPLCGSQETVKPR